MKTEYAHALRRQVGHFPVWDVGTPIEVGDFGEIHEGCFHKLGNVQREYQTATQVVESDPAFWEFASEGVERNETDLAANAAAVGVKAAVTVHFSEAYSLYVMAPESVVATLANTAAVARALKFHPLGYPREYVFVTSLRRTPSLLLMMNTSDRATISLSGDPGVLAELKGGRARGSAQFEFKGDAGLRSVGENGAVYVDLVKLRWFDGKPRPASIVAQGAEDDHYEVIDAKMFS